MAAGSGSGPTATAAYDAALAEAGVENYNLVVLSSVVPADARVAVVDEVPDIGPVGARLHVVRARASVNGGEGGGAALAWGQTADGRGLFYEADAGGDPERAEGRASEAAREGLAAGADRRDWSLAGRDCLSTAVAAGERPACAVVVATYGRAEPF